MKFKFKDKVKVIQEGFWCGTVGVVCSRWVDCYDKARYHIYFNDAPKYHNTKEFLSSDLEKIIIKPKTQVIL